jgi:hypothetical protein
MTIGTRTDWFPTPIWHFSIDDPLQLNSLLLAEISAEQQRDRQGEKWSNVLGWHSVNNLHEREAFAEFVRVVERNVLEVATFLKWDLKKFSIKMSPVRK